VTQVSAFPNILVVPRAFPADTAQELIAHVKARPGQLNYASSGIGTGTHLSMEMLKFMSGMDIVNVPYKGGAPAVQALITGEVEMAFVDAVTALPLIASKQVTAIGVSSPQRNPLAPEIPTIAESGYPGYECSSDFVLLAPAGTPPAIIQKLATAKAAALQQPDSVEKLRNGSIFPDIGAPEAWPQQIVAESTKWGEVIRSRGITLE
jgi:tripartite-type tricarboxylate transporter receptor subunit TctC